MNTTRLKPLGSDETVRTLRLKAGLSQRELAARANVEPSLLSKCERLLELPGLSFFESVGNVLGIASADLRSVHASLMGSAEIGEGYATRRNDGAKFRSPVKEVLGNPLKVYDLFCGSGGFSYGFEASGEFSVIGGIDLLPDRIDTFSVNHPTATSVCGDIRRISFRELIDRSGVPDVVIAGPPCQGFSSIRPFRTLTEQDSRNNLYEYCALFLSYAKPRWFVLENVVGLLTNSGGKTLGNVLALFEAAGYSATWTILNAAAFGLPQRRERFVLVASREARAFEWPAPTHYVRGRSMAGRQFTAPAQPTLLGHALEPAVTIMEAIHDLPELASGEGATRYRTDVNPTPYEALLRGEETELTLHEATRHSDKMLEIIKHAGFSRAALPAGLTKSGFSSSYSRLEADQPSVTLTVNFVHPASNRCIHPYQDRALTPREGARLQGFSDRFIFSGTRSQIVKQIGNAVPPLLGKVIAEAILKQS